MSTSMTIELAREFVKTMNLKETNAALGLAEANLVALQPEARGEMLLHVQALTERRLFLVAKRRQEGR